MSAYGWSHVAHVYHQAPSLYAHGWVKTPCCGERWLDLTSTSAPELAPCNGQARRCPETCRWQDDDVCPIHSELVVA